MEQGPSKVPATWLGGAIVVFSEVRHGCPIRNAYRLLVSRHGSNRVELTRSTNNHQAKPTKNTNNYNHTTKPKPNPTIYQSIFAKCALKFCWTSFVQNRIGIAAKINIYCSWQKGDRPDNDSRWAMQHPDKKSRSLQSGEIVKVGTSPLRRPPRNSFLYVSLDVNCIEMIFWYDIGDDILVWEFVWRVRFGIWKNLFDKSLTAATRKGRPYRFA